MNFNAIIVTKLSELCICCWLLVLQFHLHSNKMYTSRDLNVQKSIALIRTHSWDLSAELTKNAENKCLSDYAFPFGIRFVLIHIVFNADLHFLAARYYNIMMGTLTEKQFLNICRCCLEPKDNKNPLFPLFLQQGQYGRYAKNTNASLLEIIKTCLGLTVSELPRRRLWPIQPHMRFLMKASIVVILSSHRILTRWR